MKVSLNEEKSPFCTIGGYSFTFGTPEHDIDIDQLLDAQKKQLLYNIARGTLQTDEPYKDILGHTKFTPLVPAEVKPIQATDVADSMDDILERQIKLMKRILTGTIPSVKKEAASMRLGNLRRLMELEQKSKNRKKLISFFEKRLASHTEEVKLFKGSEELEDSEDKVKTDQLSTQLTDIVESDEGLIVLPQEVLNQIDPGE
jgi:hypothetical protein